MQYSRHFLVLALVQVFMHSRDCHGFCLQRSSARNQDVALRAIQDASQRRDFLDAVKRVFIGTGVMVSNQGYAISAAFADEVPATGKIVEFQVANLDGELGKSGTIRIQLKPEWAPRGVSRFEVSTLDHAIML